RGNQREVRAIDAVRPLSVAALVRGLHLQPVVGLVEAVVARAVKGTDADDDEVEASHLDDVADAPIGRGLGSVARDGRLVAAAAGRAEQRDGPDDGEYGP